MQFELARAADEPELRRLLRETPIEGDIRVSFEREPDFRLASEIEGEHSQVLVARPAQGEPVVAMGTRTVRECFVNGEAKRVGYLSQLRVGAPYRGRASLLRRGYALLRELHADRVADFYLTTIVSDNATARRVLEAGLPGLPSYVFVDELLTFLLPVGAVRGELPPAPGPLEIRGASEADLSDLLECLQRYGRRYQFASVWTRDRLTSDGPARGLGIGDFIVARSGSRMVGCLACWDQRAFKQWVVRGQSKRAAVLRPLMNLLAAANGTPRIPRVDERVELGFLSHLAVDDDDPAVLRAMLNAALHSAGQRGLDVAALGLSARNPLAGLPAAYYRARRYSSRVYKVFWPDGAAAANAVRDLASHLEVATL